ncbi:MAG: 16S rRNA (cytosine(1402)-N(4))-methyltransferase RsmH [Patescibacteria group bacterium]
MKNEVSSTVHVPVLLHEILETFRQEVGSWKSGVRGDASSGSRLPASGTSFWYIDGTLGGAGHALALAKEFQKIMAEGAHTGAKLNVIGFDRDDQAIARAEESLKGLSDKLILENENYRNLDVILGKHGVPAVDFILLDLGISSDELDNSGRGFTFLKDEPLLMTMGDPVKHPFTAKDIVNGWKEEDIANVIFGYGEDRYARRIAKKIVEYREKTEIKTTMELAEIVKSAVPKQFRSFGKKTIHPATKTFQGLRIAVNDELGALKEGLTKGYAHLAPGGRMAVISFHSLEDRIVKEFFKEKKETGNAHILTKKPVTAVPQEIAENPRSRSAKLRIIEKIN